MANHYDNGPMVHEYANFRTIKLHCKDCSQVITEFRYLKRVTDSRELWELSDRHTQWNANFQFDEEDNVFCSCGLYLGYKYEDGLDWVVFKRNTKVLY